jgi:hypothetical protein
MALAFGGTVKGAWEWSGLVFRDITNYATNGLP